MEPDGGPAGLADASNVLVLGSRADPAGHDCLAHLAPAPTAELSLVSVAFTEPPDERIARFRSTAGTPADTRVIAVGEGARSAATESAAAPVPVTTVEHPADLTELGIRLATAVEGPGGQELVVCFDSLTALLDHTSVRRAFRFLHVTTARLSNADALAHFHLDPEAHGDGAVATLRPLFDRVVRHDGDNLRVGDR